MSYFSYPNTVQVHGNRTQTTSPMILRKCSNDKDIKITEDADLPPATSICLSEIDTYVIGRLRTADEPQGMAQRVRVCGRVHRVAKQGALIFVTIRRGLDLM